MTISIVIPAHNEETVIAGTLDALLLGAEPGELDVVVACNGCTDRTAEIVRNYGPAVRSVEVAEASKAAALNVGDGAVTAFPRIYLDADVDVSIRVIRSVAALLRVPSARVAAPHVEFDLSGCSWAVRAYHGVWQRLPYIADGLIGTGFYGLSESGRARFDAFPMLVADDLFVRGLFDRGERKIAEGTFRVHPPREVRSLMRSKTRAYAGNLQMARAQSAGDVPSHGGRARRDGGTSGTREALARLARSPSWWPRLAAYLAVVTISKLRAEIRIRRGQAFRWDQDVTSRTRDS